MNTTDEFVATSLGQVHVAVAGEGDPLVMWPSLLMDASLWTAQITHFAQHRLTIAVDPPGHGKSAPLERGFTFDECAQCVIDILDHLGLPRTDFIGNSWGAMLGGTLAAKFPDRIRCIVLMNGTASPAPGGQKLQYRALLTLIRILRGIRPPLTRAAVHAFLGPTTQQTRPHVVRQVLDLARRNDVKSIDHAVRSVLIERPDQRDLFASITCPTLVVAGREDRTFPLRELETMAALIPGAELAIIDDAAHLAAVEVPDLVNKIVQAFLTHTAPQSAS